MPENLGRVLVQLKTVVKRTGIIEKHCSAFARLFKGFCPETEEVYIN